MPDGRAGADVTAVRMALWRAMHVQVDALPHVFEDEVGLRLADPGEEWRRRPDMDPRATSRARASSVARARFIEDVVAEEARKGVRQYVILGAGLDTFAERKLKRDSGLTVFEVDRPGTVEWKRKRLVELGYGQPEWLRLVPADFIEGSWWDDLVSAGFDDQQPAVVASVGVSHYQSRDENEGTLYRIGGLVAGSTLVMAFLLPEELMDVEERPERELTVRMAQAVGTPFMTFYAPQELEALARESGFENVQLISSAQVAQRYFAGRTDGLAPSSGEELLVART